MHATRWVRLDGGINNFFIKFQVCVGAIFNVFYVFSMYEGNTKETLMSADSDEAWTRKGFESEIYIYIYIYLGLPKANFSCFAAFFNVFLNIKERKAFAQITLAYCNRGN